MSEPRRPARVNWKNLETHVMLTIIKEKNIIRMLDGKRYRNGDIFKIVEEGMKKRGFFKSLDQIRAKWKQLKTNYFKAKRSNNVSGAQRVECPFWEELDELLGHRPAARIDGSMDSSQLEDSLEIPNELVDSMAEVSVKSDDVEATENGILQEINPNTPTTSATPKIVRNKNKGKKNSYKEALSGFTNDWRGIIQETTANMLSQQTKLFEEFEKQRNWEKELLEEERKGTEIMLNNIMGQFFNNLKTAINPNPIPMVFTTPFVSASQVNTPPLQNINDPMVFTTPFISASQVNTPPLQNINDPMVFTTPFISASQVNKPPHQNCNDPMVFTSPFLPYSQTGKPPSHNKN